MTSREDAARALIDARSEGGRCELHGGLGSNIHHRNKEGRRWVGSNLLRLCGSGTTGCHGWIEGHPQFAIALGLWVPRALDPATESAYCRPILFGLGWWRPDDAGMWHAAVEPAHLVNDGLPAAYDALQQHLATVGALS